jgi:hypothetical protein
MLKIKPFGKILFIWIVLVVLSGFITKTMKVLFRVEQNAGGCLIIHPTPCCPCGTMYFGIVMVFPLEAIIIVMS